MLKEDYQARYGLEVDFGVVHISELLHEQLGQGKLTIEKGVEKKVTYHDPCNLGRYMGVYSSPREVVKGLGEGMELVRWREQRKMHGVAARAPE